MTALNGKTLEAKLVFSRTLSYLYEEVKGEYPRACGAPWREKQVMWILTTPAILGDRGKAFMIEAAKDVSQAPQFLTKLVGGRGVLRRLTIRSYCSRLLSACSSYTILCLRGDCVCEVTGYGFIQVRQHLALSLNRKLLKLASILHKIRNLSRL